MNGEAFTILNPRFKFPSKGKETKTASYVFSGFSNSISRGWERKSTTGRFAIGRIWSRTWKSSSVGRNQVSN